MSEDLLGVPPALLPADAAAPRLAGLGDRPGQPELEAVAASYPASSLAWAVLAEHALEQLLGVGHHRGEVDDLGVAGPAPAEQQEPAGQLVRPVRGGEDLAHVLGGARPGLDGLLEEAGVVGDDGEQVVEVVGNAAGELPQALKPLRLVLGLLLESMGDVTDDGPDDDPLVGVESAEADLSGKLGTVLAPAR